MVLVIVFIVVVVVAQGSLARSMTKSVKSATIIRGGSKNAKKHTSVFPPNSAKLDLARRCANASLGTQRNSFLAIILPEEHADHRVPDRRSVHLNLRS
eukprot:scaffold88272_cov57-Attheya_sp.AAC.3